MKKLLTACVLSLAALALVASQASAWPNLLHHCCHKCSYSFCICCRPYNAFSPICCGNISCCGCCPTVNCGGGCGGFAPAACGAECGGGYVGELPVTDPALQNSPRPGAPAIPFQAPMPSPDSRTVPMNYGAMMFPAQPMVRPAGAYAPAYYPPTMLPYGVTNGAY